jgi:predicted molibdopterin-dependent oxidoreductase YjgC
VRDTSVARGQAVRLDVDGETISAFEGECLAVVLAVAGHLTLRHSPEAGGSRGFFCLMGVCQECVVDIDGDRRAACMEVVREGMTVTLGGARDHGGRSRAIADDHAL